jgi:site-specific recombinase XerD
MTASAAVTQLRAHQGGLAAWESEREAWFIHLRANRRSPNTLATYGYALAAFVRFRESQGASLDPASVSRRDAEGFNIWMQDQGWRPSSQASRFIAVAAFFAWLASEDEAAIPADPFRALRPAVIPDVPVPVVSAVDVAALLRACAGRDFLAVRDKALILFMLDSGCRREEVVGMTLEELDVVAGGTIVHGKGDRTRWVSFGPETQEALNRYLRLRRAHKRADKVETFGDRPDSRWRGRPLWLGDARTGRGGIGGASIQRILEARAREAGIAHIHPHQLRHTWADAVKLQGMESADIKRLGGWRSDRSLERYGRSNADARARANYKSPVSFLLTPRRRG